MLVGSEVDDPEYTKLFEMCGEMVVADRYFFGSMPGRDEIDIKEDETPLHALARHYLMNNVCPRTMGPSNIEGRKIYIYNKAVEYKAEGIIFHNMKFCEYWGYERAQDAHWFQDAFVVPASIPTCQVERDYTTAAAGQLRTRFQAFIESLEIKRIQEKKGV